MPNSESAPSTSNVPPPLATDASAPKETQAETQAPEYVQVSHIPEEQITPAEPDRSD
jgi:hypothetical protein